ncbi:MAG: aspartate/glutamate racemase family protein [Candidatus Aerophobetes bacterium]|nr:aspartate/glutamate racemase family protein [Candidatus Aerophobetes bacterium]
MNRRLGLIIPSSNTTMEPEFYHLLSPDFSIHTARMRLKEVTADDLAKMEEEAVKESLKLADAGVEVIGYGCTSGSLLKGTGHDKVIEEEIKKFSGVPAVTTATAVIDALKALKVKKIAVATPYIDEINRLEKKFLLENGFQIVDFKAFGIKENLKIGRLKPEQAYKLVMELAFKEAEAIFISCTNFSTKEVIEKLERKLKKPVISSNTATLWAMLKKFKASKPKIEGYGKLLREKLR